MTQRFIPAAFIRGGSSKGVFFHARDLPGDLSGNLSGGLSGNLSGGLSADRAAIDPILLGVLGSPDPYGRQLNGMGGGVSSLSKAVIIGPPTHPDADVDYIFAQVSVDRPVVDWGSNCGNLSSAVGPFAVDEALVQVPDGEALVRIHQVNTKKIIHARFPVANGRAVVGGDFAIPGVAGTGARIRLDFLSPGGAFTAALLPTGNPVDGLEIPGAGSFRVSLVDATNCVAFVDARDLGLTGAETPDEMEARPGLMALLDQLRRAAAVRMGLAATPQAAGLANPKIALVAPPGPFRTLTGEVMAAATHEIAVRMISMERAHRAVPLTGAMCLSVACRIEGSIPHALCAVPARADEIRIANPSGVFAAGAEVRNTSAGPVADSAVVYRTSRRLMQGQVAWDIR